MKYRLSPPYLERAGMLLAFTVLPPLLAVVATRFLHGKAYFYWIGYLLEVPSLLAGGIGFWTTPKKVFNTTLPALFIHVLWPPPANEGRLFATMGDMTGTGTVFLDDGRLYIEQRLEELEQTVIKHADQIKNFGNKQQDFLIAINRSEETRIADHQEIMSKLNIALRDGLPVAAISLVWLFIGIGFSAYGGWSPTVTGLPVVK